MFAKLIPNNSFSWNLFEQNSKGIINNSLFIRHKTHNHLVKKKKKTIKIKILYSTMIRSKLSCCSDVARADSVSG